MLVGKIVNVYLLDEERKDENQIKWISADMTVMAETSTGFILRPKTYEGLAAPATPEYFLPIHRLNYFIIAPE